MSFDHQAEAVGSTPKRTRLRPYAPLDVMDAVAEYYHLDRADLDARAGRYSHLMEARHVCAYVLRHLCDYSFPFIAKMLSHGDHTTPRHSVKKVEADELMSGRAAEIMEGLK